jgi:hypothetical protein
MKAYIPAQKDRFKIARRWLKSEIQNGYQEAFFALFFTLKMTHLHLHFEFFLSPL